MPIKVSRGDHVRVVRGDADMVNCTGEVVHVEPDVGLVWIVPDHDPSDQWMLDWYAVEKEPA